MYTPQSIPRKRPFLPFCLTSEVFLMNFFSLSSRQRGACLPALLLQSEWVVLEEDRQDRAWRLVEVCRDTEAIRQAAAEDPLGAQSWCAAACSTAEARLMLCLWAGPFYLLSFLGKEGCFLKQLEAENSRQKHTRPFRPYAPLKALSASAVHRMAIR